MEDLVQQEPLRGYDRNPIGGRTGQGEPFCPPGWTWRTGNRVQDMYFTAPGPNGERFRSKTELKVYLDKLPDGPRMEDFHWKAPAYYLKTGEVPGVPYNVRPRGGFSRRGRGGAGRGGGRGGAGRGGAGRGGAGRGGRGRGGYKRKAVEDLDRDAAMDLDEEEKKAKLKDVARKTLMVSSTFSTEPKIEPQAYTSLPFLAQDRADEGNPTVEQAIVPLALPAPVKRKRGRPRSSVDDHTFTTILSTVTSYKWLTDTSDDLRRFMQESERLGQRSEEEMLEYRRLLLSRTHDAVSMRRYTKPVLHTFVRILRNEEAPDFLGRLDLADLCCNWRCKHRRYFCLLEEGRIQGMRQCRMDKEAFSSARLDKEALWRLMGPEDEATAYPSQNGGLAADAADETGQIVQIGEETNTKLEQADECSSLSKGGEIEPVSEGRRTRRNAPRVNVCFCKACSSEAKFCRGCVCGICNTLASPAESWRVVKCTSCQHLFHLDCAVETKCAGVVKEVALDVEFFCSLCNCKMDLFPFWRERVHGAIASKDVASLEKHIQSAVTVLRGSQRKHYAPLHERMEEAYNVLLQGSNYPEVYCLLQQIEQQLDSLGVNQLTAGDSNALVPDLQQSEKELLELEVRVFQLQKLADEDHKEWSEKEKVADAKRLCFQEAEEQLKIAADAAKEKCEKASASRLLVHKEKQRLTALRERAEPLVFTAAELEAKNQVMQGEYRELERLESELRELDQTDAVGISKLQDRIAIQQIRVNASRARFGKLLNIANLRNATQLEIQA